MTKFKNKSFTVAMGGEKYRDNWDQVFGKKKAPPEIARCPECGSWDQRCGSETPVERCGCARCLRVTVHKLEQQLANVEAQLAAALGPRVGK